MKNSENPKFEESWKDAFADAEAGPSENVWTNIDLQLSRAESGDMKRRVVFYQRLAAASVIFALALGSMGIWYWTKDGVKEIASTEMVGKKNEGVTNIEDTIKENETTKLNEENLESQIAGENVPQGNEAVKLSEESLESQMVNSKEKNTASVDYGKINEATNHKNAASSFIKKKNQINNSTDQFNQVAIVQKPDDANYLGDNLKEKSNESVWRNIVLSSNSLPEAEAKPKGVPVEEIAGMKKSSRTVIAKEDKKKKKNEDENWWASVGGSAGSYNPQSGTSGTSATSLALKNQSFSALSSAPVSERATIGTSFSFGMTFGKKVAQRWVVLSGVNYLSQSIGYNSNIAVVDANNQSKAYAADLVAPSANVTSTSPYAINSVSEFVSIPLQTGYLIVDRKMGIQLNTGIATDFFIKNTLTDESGKFSSYSESAGNNSYYRTLNWTGLVGTEFSYKVAKHYRVSLVPGLRYSFNSVLKSSTGSSLNPMVWDVGFRFRYIF
ncbi:MAG: hypothetical protein ACKVOQ_05540 [Cyclobacteriaceae bacterium]